jgi:hypothetical protein
MANTKISALTSATTPLAGTEVLPIVQSGSTVKVANNDLRPKQIQSNATSGVMQVAGPAAASTRVMTIPNANFTAARTDAAQSFTGQQDFNADVVVNSASLKVNAGAGGYYAGISVAYNFPTVDSYFDSVASTSYTGQLMFRNSSNGGAMTERARIDGNGNFIVGDTTSASRVRIKGANSTDDLFRAVTFGGTSAYYSCASNASLSTGESATASVWYVRKDAATSRSINAAGTINASGADYAEYMTKAGNFTIAKGDVVGVNAQGKLTNVFADAVSFVVKSTDPSYVGGDVWGNTNALGLTQPEKPSRIPDEVELRLVSEATETEEAVHEIIVTKSGDSDQEWAAKEAAYATAKTAFDTALEAARQKVDRIAFAGQVPVNVLGATAGQYIVPVNDNGTIKGNAVSNPTFEQYQSAVGKVIAIEADGRARIIVKVV